MAQILIKLDEEDNQEYYGLWREHDEIKKQWDELNNQIHEIRTPKLLIWRTRRKLKSIGIELDKLQSNYLKWRKKAVNFTINPHYKIARDENFPIIYLQATQNMRDLNNMLETNILVIANNYNIVYTSLNNQQNFILALSSFTLAILALAITLISILCSS